MNVVAANEGAQPDSATGSSPDLVRGLGPWQATVVVSTIIGTQPIRSSVGLAIVLGLLCYPAWARKRRGSACAG